MYFGSLIYVFSDFWSGQYKCYDIMWLRVSSEIPGILANIFCPWNGTVISGKYTQLFSGFNLSMAGEKRWNVGPWVAGTGAQWQNREQRAKIALKSAYFTNTFSYNERCSDYRVYSTKFLKPENPLICVTEFKVNLTDHVVCGIKWLLYMDQF